MIYESIIMYINIWYINIYNVTVSHFPLSIYFDVLWKVQFTSYGNLLFFLYHQQTIYRTLLSMRVTRQMSYKRQERLTLRKHRVVHLFSFVFRFCALFVLSLCPMLSLRFSPTLLLLNVNKRVVQVSSLEEYIM